MNTQTVLDLIKDTAREIAAREELVPFVFLLQEDSVVAVPVILDENHKTEFPVFLSKILKAGLAQAYALVTEAWSSSSQRALQGQPISTLPPDDRQEIIQVLFCERNGKPTISIAPINNTPRGREIGPWEESKHTSIGGRLLVTTW